MNCLKNGVNGKNGGIKNAKAPPLGSAFDVSSKKVNLPRLHPLQSL